MGMTDSSSSSDEEEKAKLASAAWPTLSHGNNQRGTKFGVGPEQKKSLRNQEDFKEQGDYRNLNATPETKAFIAKKLTAWLDSSISVVDGETSGGATSVATVANFDDDFHLFATSKPGLPAKQNSQAVNRKQRPLSSSSDSDSDEEREKLSSVAVSYHQLIQASCSQPPDAHDAQVTSNLSPTNPHSTLTPSAPSAPIPSDARPDAEPESREKLAEVISGNAGMKKKKRKKKKQKSKIETTSESVEQSNESGLPQVVGNTQSEGKTLRKLPNDFENGTELTVERSEPRPKKKKTRKKKKNQGLREDGVTPSTHGIDSETSVR